MVIYVLRGPYHVIRDETAYQKPDLDAPECLTGLPYQNRV